MIADTASLPPAVGQIGHFRMDGKRWKISLIFALTLFGCMCWTDPVTNGWNLLPNGSHKPPFINDMKCKCTNRTIATPLGPSLVASTCDSFATMRGGNQSVITYAFYGDVKGPYFKGIAINAEMIHQKYPGWLMRVYHKMDIKSDSVRDLLCPLWCRHHHLDFCQVENLPAPLFNQSNVNARVWRFNVLGDPLVDRFLSRDLDSIVSDREVAAVNQWLKSGRKWHFMHDHPFHFTPILAGMWGGLNYNLTLNTDLRRRLIASATNDSINHTDQHILIKILLPMAESDGDYVNHDSYTCGGLPKHSWPWPVKRKSVYEFVGSAILRMNMSLPYECPKRCRPKNQQDWTYC